MTVTPHARRQCEQRGFGIDDVLRVATRKLADATARSAAVLIGWLDTERVGVVTSNGDEVWAIVRDGQLVTVMCRRSTQPKVRGAFDVELVVA